MVFVERLETSLWGSMLSKCENAGILLAVLTGTSLYLVESAEFWSVFALFSFDCILLLLLFLFFLNALKVLVGMAAEAHLHLSTSGAEEQWSRATTQPSWLGSRPCPVSQ